MIQINKFGKQHIKQKMENEKEGQDLNRYEIDLEYFADWFKSNENKIKDKYDYFYGPYSKDHMMIDNVRSRTIAIMD